MVEIYFVNPSDVIWFEMIYDVTLMMIFCCS